MMGWWRDGDCYPWVVFKVTLVSGTGNSMLLALLMEAMNILLFCIVQDSQFQGNYQTVYMSAAAVENHSHLPFIFL